MASSDATPFPVKNQAFRVTFPILDNTGSLVSGAAALDSEVSKDGGTFADVTAEATEIATSSGVYFLDLTATEMNADTVAIIVKTTTTDAKTTTLVLYPQTDGLDRTVDVTHWNGTAVATPTVAGVPEVDVTHLGGVAQSLTDLKDFADAGYDPATNKVQGVVLVDTTTTNTDLVTAAVTADAVWDEDATGHQTLGTFGQAIGDPVANTETIYDAVVTDAAGTNVAADVIAVKADTAAILVDTADMQPKLGTPAADVSADIAAVKVDTAAILVDTGTTIPADIATAQADLDIITGAAGALLDSTATSAQLVDDVWDEVLTGATHNVAQSSGRRLRALSGLIIEDGTAQSATANTIVLAVGDVTADNQFKRSKVLITAGTGVGQEAVITSSVASTDTLTVTPAWLVNPDATSEYEILPAQVHATVRNGGYDNGFVYVDSNSGNTGQQEGVDGTSTNPLDNLTDAYAIAAIENINNFLVEGGSALTLPSNSDDKVFEGDNYTVALNSQEISGISFLNASLSGVGVATAGDAVNVRLCGIGTVTLPPTNGVLCGFFGTFTIGVAGSYTFGQSSTVFDLPFVVDFAALGATSFHLVGWLGGDVEVRNMAAGDVFHITGVGNLVIAASNAAGTVEVSGNITVSDSGSATLDRVGDLNEIKGATFDPSTDSLEAIRDNTGTLGAALTDLGGMSTGMKAEVNAEVVDVIFTDTDAEPGQGTPGATISIADKIGFLYKAWRNKSTSTATAYSLFNDDTTTVDQKSTLSDDATTATKTEVTTGP